MTDLHTKADEITAALGRDWSHTPGPEDNYCTIMTRRDGLTLEAVCKVTSFAAETQRCRETQRNAEKNEQVRSGKSALQLLCEPLRRRVSASILLPLQTVSYT
jgi:hypothetical protein